jgi:hypothetical protein
VKRPSPKLLVLVVFVNEARETSPCSLLVLAPFEARLAPFKERRRGGLFLHAS